MFSLFQHGVQESAHSLNMIFNDMLMVYNNGRIIYVNVHTRLI